MPSTPSKYLDDGSPLRKTVTKLFRPDRPTITISLRTTLISQRTTIALFGVIALFLTSISPVFAAPITLTSSLKQSPKPKLNPKLNIAKPKPKPPKPKPVKPGELQPFFDSVETGELLSFPRGIEVDAMPKPPMVTEFDQQVLNTCGAFGSGVSVDQVRSLFEKNPDIVAQIKQAVEESIVPPPGVPIRRQSKEAFFEDLVAMWTGQRGFEHIFCGQVKGNQIRGLHFAARYYELQRKGVAGRLPSNQRQEEVILGLVYTVGIQAKVNGRMLNDSKAGYSYVSSALEILIDGTRAYTQFKINSGQNNSVCLYNAEDIETLQKFKAVFVKNDRGIVTLYPDATPNAGERACDQSPE